MKYNVRDHSLTMPTDELISRFQFRERLMNSCRQCANYGRLWVCPPFRSDIADYLPEYGLVMVIATRMRILPKSIPLSEFSNLIAPERERIESRLLEMERIYSGKSFAFVGNCLYCKDMPCSRISGRPCRHPDKARPSLESLGFDLGLLVKEKFGFEIEWSKDSFIPEHVTLVSGFFHNTPTLTF